jgi:hypothetical protein
MGKGERKMSSHKAKVVSLTSRRKERDARTDFLDLIDKDLGENAQPIPQAMITDMDELCDAIRQNEESEAIEC